MLLRKSAVIGLAAIGLSAGLAYSAKADVLPVTNLEFNTFDPGSSFIPPKDLFTQVKPTGWSLVRPRESTTLSMLASKVPKDCRAIAPAPIFTLFIPTLASRLPFRPAPTSIRRTAIRSSRARSSRPFQG